MNEKQHWQFFKWSYFFTSALDPGQREGVAEVIPPPIFVISSLSPSNHWLAKQLNWKNRISQRPVLLSQVCAN